MLSVAGVGLIVALVFGGRAPRRARGARARSARRSASPIRRRRRSRRPRRRRPRPRREPARRRRPSWSRCPRPRAPRPSRPRPRRARAEGHLLQQRLVPRRQVAAARWVTLAGEKRFGEAYGLLRQVPLRELSDPDDLMLAADVARQAGRPERAVPFLERVVNEHPKRGRGAARGLLARQDLPRQPRRAGARGAPLRGRPRDGAGAAAWRRTRSRARSRPGRAPARPPGRATARSSTQRLYPHGRRLAAVRDLGGI